MKKKLGAVLLVVALALALAVLIAGPAATTMTDIIEGTNWQKTTNYKVENNARKTAFPCDDEFWS